jgi:hypothetical protein
VRVHLTCADGIGVGLAVGTRVGVAVGDNEEELGAAVACLKSPSSFVISVKNAKDSSFAASSRPAGVPISLGLIASTGGGLNNSFVVPSLRRVLPLLKAAEGANERTRTSSVNRRAKAVGAMLKAVLTTGEQGDSEEDVSAVRTARNVADDSGVEN